MVQITYLASTGRAFVVNGNAGDSLMRLAIGNGVPGIEAECGGAMACGTCRVGIPAEWVSQISPADEDEAQMLEYCESPAPATRLSCQVEISEALNGLHVTIPNTQY